MGLQIYTEAQLHNWLCKNLTFMTGSANDELLNGW